MSWEFILLILVVLPVISFIIIIIVLCKLLRVQSTLDEVLHLQGQVEKMSTIMAKLSEHSVQEQKRLNRIKAVVDEIQHNSLK